MRRTVGVLALLLVGLYGCGASESGGGPAGGGTGAGGKRFTNSSYPFSFTYPKDFHITRVTRVDQTAGGGATDRVAIALDENNAIFLSRSEADDIPVDASNIRDVLPEVNDVVASLIGRPAEGDVQTLGGFPSVIYGSQDISTPPQGQSRMAFIFDGKHQYFMNCQSTPERRPDINAACDLALSTLKKK